MADSDDDYDRRRRDKFRGERSEYRGAGEAGRRDDRGTPRRDEWSDRFVVLHLFTFSSHASIMTAMILHFGCMVRAMMEPRRGDSWAGARGSRSQPRHPEYRDSYRGRERYSPAGGYEAPQPPKRMRSDWWVV